MAPVRSKKFKRQGRERRTAAALELEIVQDGAHQTQARHRAAVVHRAGDRFGFGAGLGAAAADLERARRDVRKMKAAGVGEDRDVDVRRDLRRQRHAERLDDVEHHLAACRRAMVEPVDRAVALVAGVMIDVDDEIFVEPLDAGSRQIAALHHDGRVELSVNAG